MTPLLRAAGSGQTDVVVMLLDEGANGKHFDTRNRGILWLARHVEGGQMFKRLERYRFADGSKLEWRDPIPVADGKGQYKQPNASKLYRHWGGH